ncbi:predicted protein, partial [Nematostella vectensis]
TEVLLVDLYKYVRYSIYAVAFTDKDGKLSNTLTLYTLEDVPDRPPQTITFSFPSPTSLGLEWDPVSFGYQNGIIEGYKITWSRGNLTKKMDLHHGNRFTTIDGLESYKWYNISISAYTSVGEGVAFKERVLTNENRRDYQTFDKIYEDLVSGYVGGALLDSLALSSRKDLFEKPFIRVHK